MNIKDDITTLRKCVDTMQSMRYTPPLKRARGWKCYEGSDGYMSPVASYASLWRSINGPESWTENPWVWVVKFRRKP
jgi:hypothetical protein